MMTLTDVAFSFCAFILVAPNRLRPCSTRDTNDEINEDCLRYVCYLCVSVCVFVSVCVLMSVGVCCRVGLGYSHIYLRKIEYMNRHILYI